MGLRRLEPDFAIRWPHLSGCKRDEIALVRNATEANSYIANGIEMNAGDEVLMTDQEHPGGLQPWRLRAKRYGVVIKTVTLPKPVKDASQVLNLFNDAITPRTRVIFFSHITTVTGVVLPAKELCALARSKNILSAVDGAHVTGMMRLNLHDLGCDMYSSSPHKWLQATKGSGFLYVRDEVIDGMWNTIATEGWDEPELRAERFQRIGSSNVPALWGLLAAIKLANEIGMERIERRHREALRLRACTQMIKRDAESWTSPDAAFALRHCDRKRSPTPAHGDGELDVEDAQDSHPWRRTVEAEGCPRRTICRKKISTVFWKRSDEFKKKKSIA